MDEETLEQNKDQESAVDSDPWAAAFAALEQADAKGAEGDTAPQGDPAAGEAGKVPDGAGVNGQSEAAVPYADGDGASDAGKPGEPGDGDGADGAQVGEDTGDGVAFSEDELSQYKESVLEGVRDRAIADVAQAFINKGIRNHDGVLGARIDDPDICKYDDDKVPHFFNPETGREFDGNNPRREAQQWVDDYNKELKDAFNRTCSQYVDKLMKDEQPSIAVLEFAPQYEKLDPIRKGMLDSLLEDYEVTDKDGDVIGYSVDLNTALAAVNRQVQTMQQYYKAQTPSQSEPAAPAAQTPALDMKSTASGGTPGREPRSLAEALEAQQNALLEKMRSK